MFLRDKTNDWKLKAGNFGFAEITSFFKYRLAITVPMIGNNLATNCSMGSCPDL